MGVPTNERKDVPAEGREDVAAGGDPVASHRPAIAARVEGKHALDPTRLLRDH
jgi:hypothetical protein